MHLKTLEEDLSLLSPSFFKTVLKEEETKYFTLEYSVPKFFKYLGGRPPPTYQGSYKLVCRTALATLSVNIHQELSISNMQLYFIFIVISLHCM